MNYNNTPLPLLQSNSIHVQVNKLHLHVYDIQAEKMAFKTMQKTCCQIEHKVRNNAEYSFVKKRLGKHKLTY